MGCVGRVDARTGGWSVTETTTIRIPVTTKERLSAFRNDELQSLGDIVHWLATIVPTRNDNTIARDRIAAYLRTYLIRDFGNQDELTPGDRLWADLAALQHRADLNSASPAAVILDHTALAKFATGHRQLAQLVYAQPNHHERRIYAPTQAIYTATVQHAALADHLDKIGVIHASQFDLAAALTVGKKVPTNATPAVAHVVHEAKPSMEWPNGRPVITTVPQMYTPYQLQVYALPEQG
jgi:hypothetical protein